MTATGLNLQPLGGIELRVDGREIALPETLVYRGAMISGVPNLAFAFGYINQSWTLGADLTAQHVCRLLNYMDERGYDRCTPRNAAASLASGTLPRALVWLCAPRRRSVPPAGIRRPVVQAPELCSRPPNRSCARRSTIPRSSSPARGPT